MHTLYICNWVKWLCVYIRWRLMTWIFVPKTVDARTHQLHSNINNAVADLELHANVVRLLFHCIASIYDLLGGFMSPWKFKQDIISAQGSRESMILFYISSYYSNSEQKHITILKLTRLSRMRKTPGYLINISFQTRLIFQLSTLVSDYVSMRI